jgi:hypothetical protein
MERSRLQYRDPAAEEQAARHFGVGFDAPGRPLGERPREGVSFS